MFKKFVSIILVFIVTICVTFCFSACQGQNPPSTNPDSDTNPQKVMCGRLVSDDGNVERSFEMSLIEHIEKKPDARDTMTIEMNLPVDFPYIFAENETYYNGSGEIEAMPYFTGSGMALGKISNEPESFTFAFSEEKRWAVFVWESAPKQYFIVTPEPNVSITEVIDYFKIFLNILPY